MDREYAIQRFQSRTEATLPLTGYGKCNTKSVKFSPAAVVSWTHDGGQPSVVNMLQEMTLLCDEQPQLERQQQNLRPNHLTGYNWLMQHTMRPPDSTPEGLHTISRHRHATTHVHQLPPSPSWIDQSCTNDLYLLPPIQVDQFLWIRTAHCFYTSSSTGRPCFLEALGAFIPLHQIRDIFIFSLTLGFPVFLNFSAMDW